MHNRQDKANLIASLQHHEGFKVLMEHMTTQMEAHRNELENPNSNADHIRGRIASYRDIFNYIAEKIKDSKDN